MEIQLLCRPELDFEVPGLLEMSFSLPWSPFQKLERIRRLMSGGGAQKNLSGLGVPPLVAKMVIGTATGYDPKGQLLADVWEQDSEL